MIVDKANGGSFQPRLGVPSFAVEVTFTRSGRRDDERRDKVSRAQRVSGRVAP